MDDLARLVARDAETSRLLGADFVPAYRSTPTAPAAPPQAVAARVIEPKPAPARPEVVVKAVPPAPGPAPAPKPAAAAPPAAAGSPMDLLRARYERDAPHTKFVTAHTSIVWGEGDPKARLMFVGEAPGAEEDRCGRPFVGRSGQLLEKMIQAMGLSRQSVYIANVLKTRPPDNATPTFEEVRLCAPYLFEQIGIVGPQVIVTLGLPAARALLNTTDSMSRLRGQWASFSPPPPYARPIAVMPTYHPAFLLRSYTAENRAKVWSDLRLAMERLGLPAPSGKSPA